MNSRIFSILLLFVSFFQVAESYDANFDNFDLYRSSFNIYNSTNEFVLVTMPKTGTHLMQPLLKKLSGKEDMWASDVFPNAYEVKDINVRDQMFSVSKKVPIHWFLTPIPQQYFIAKLYELARRGKYLSAHAPFSKPLENVLLSRRCVAFFVVRDPRDYVVSILNHVNKFPNDFLTDDWFYSLSIDEQIYYIIAGTTWYNSTQTIVNEFMKWKDSPACCALRFEKLIGPSGGACTQEEHIQELRKIATALGVEISDEDLLKAFKESYGKGYTFNKAKVGRWKDYFNESHKQIFKELLGKELIELGYEKDLNW